MLEQYFLFFSLITIVFSAGFILGYRLATRTLDDKIIKTAKQNHELRNRIAELKTRNYYKVQGLKSKIKKLKDS